MLRRKIEHELLKWKNTEGHKPLILKGVRQCGKTYSVMDFARKNYSNVIYLNFMENPKYHSIFSGSLQVDDLIISISALLGEKAVFERGKTILVFDEIQECPEARSALKPIAVDGRFDCICTGSLLGIKGYGNSTSAIPVGYESIIDMYPLDFEEFLWANGISDEVIDKLEEYFALEIPIPDAIHNRMRELLLEYAVVGGMPAVVSVFISSKQMNNVLAMQRDIINSYKDDMVKYADAKDKALIRECFESIPKQLGKENKKFQYSLVRSGSTSSRFRGSLQWLEDIGIISRCYNLSIMQLPLDGNSISDIFKVYMVDSGLFVSMLEDGSQFDILQGNLQIYKGAIFENLIADIFTKMGRRLYYYRKNSGLEIDFVIRYKGICTPVEVKAVSGNAKSLKTIMADSDTYHIRQAIKLGDYNIGRNGNILTLPLYMAFLLREF